MASIFDLQPYNDYRPDWTRRGRRYQLYRAYHEGTAYDRLKGITAANKLYAGTRTLFSPLRRCVRVDVSKIPASWALPEKDAAQSTIDQVKELRKSLGLEAVYRRFLTYGAVAGEAGILMSGAPEAPTFTAHRPDEIVRGTLPNGLPFALIVRRVVGIGKPYEYAQVITAERVSTYKNGKLFAYPGQQRAEAPNAFGFIPLAFGPYREEEDGTGGPAFVGVVELLDRVNEIASLMLDVIARNAEPLLVISGARKDAINMEPGDDTLVLDKSDARAYTVNPNLALSEALTFIQDVRGEFKVLLPQLGLDFIRGASDLAYDTVLTMLMELGDHIVAVRENVDPIIEQVEGWAFEATAGGVPDDYELWRERRWIALSESQQLDLEAKRQQIDAAKQQAQIAKQQATTAPGAQETEPNEQARTGTARNAATGERPGKRDGAAGRSR